MRSRGSPALGTDQVTFGYRAVEVGQPSSGRTGWVICPDEAATIIEIFERFVAGETPRAIAHRLNAHGVPAKGGRPWTDSIIRGHTQRGSGILRNEIYAGRQIRHRLRYFKDPKTGREIGRLNPEETWVVSEVPSLRIIPQELWDQAQAQLRQRSTAVSRTVHTRGRWGSRPRGHLLDGITKCGTCGSNLLLVRGDEISCCPTRTKACPSPVLIRLSFVEQVLIDAASNRFVHNAGSEFLNAFRNEFKLTRKRTNLMRAAIQREYRTVSRHLSNLVATLEAGMQAPEIRARTDYLSHRKAELEARLARLEAPIEDWDTETVSDFRERIRLLKRTAKAAPSEQTKVVRDLLEKILITRRGDVFHFELFGKMARIFALARYSELLEGAAPSNSVTLIMGNWSRREVV